MLYFKYLIKYRKLLNLKFCRSIIIGIINLHQSFTGKYNVKFNDNDILSKIRKLFCEGSDIFDLGLETSFKLKRRIKYFNEIFFLKKIIFKIKLIKWIILSIDSRNYLTLKYFNNKIQFVNVTSGLRDKRILNINKFIFFCFGHQKKRNLNFKFKNLNLYIRFINKILIKFNYNFVNLFILDSSFGFLGNILSNNYIFLISKLFNNILIGISRKYFLNKLISLECNLDIKSVLIFILILNFTKSLFRTHNVLILKMLMLNNLIEI